MYKKCIFILENAATSTKRQCSEMKRNRKTQSQGKALEHVPPGAGQEQRRHNDELDARDSASELLRRMGIEVPRDR